MFALFAAGMAPTAPEVSALRQEIVMWAAAARGLLQAVEALAIATVFRALAVARSYSETRNLDRAVHASGKFARMSNRSRQGLG